MSTLTNKEGTQMTTSTKILRRAVVGVALAVLFAMAIAALYVAVLYGIVSLTGWLQALANVVGDDEAMVLLERTGTFLLFAFATFVLIRILMLVVRLASEQDEETGTRPRAVRATGVMARHRIAEEYGDDVAEIARQSTWWGTQEDTRRLAVELDEQIRAGKRVRPSDMVKRHEAAHAIVANALGHQVNAIEISPLAGCVSTREMTTANTIGEFWDNLTVIVAGPATDSGFADSSEYGDTSRAMKLAAHMVIRGERPTGYDGPFSIEGLLAGASDRARLILEAHRAMFGNLVAVLQDRAPQKFVLRGEELAELLTDPVSTPVEVERVLA